MGKTVLVVDDDDAVRKSISAVLKLKGGFETLEAIDGLIGLEMAKQHHPDLIISDVVMDNFDGFRLLETLKESPETSNIPVIMLTTEELIQGEWKTGAAVDYLAKGFTITELLYRVNSILDNTITS